MTERIIGIDLSLTGTALVCIPADWDLDWRRVQFTTFGEPLKKTASTVERVNRLRSLALRAADWVEVQRATHVWIEGYPASGRAFNLDKLAELGGAVRVALLERCGLSAETAPQSSARKLLLGSLPQRDRKKIVEVVVRSMTPPFQTVDEIDAFVVANWGLSELGLCAITAEAA